MKVDIGKKLREAFPWLEELGADQIEALKAEIRDCYAKPEVKLKDAALLGKVYRDKENEVEARATERNDLRFMMLNFWRQHNVTEFGAGDVGSYQVIPRVEISFDDEEVEELIDRKAWLEVTVPKRVVDPALLLAWFGKEGCPLSKKKLIDLLLIDCTPEIRPPRQTPKQQDAVRVLGKTAPRKRKKKK